MTPLSDKMAKRSLAWVLNDTRGFHVDTLDEATREALLDRLLRATRELPPAMARFLRAGAWISQRLKVVSGMTPKPCRSCGAPLIWGVTEQGKRMPVDAQPVKRIVLEAALNVDWQGNALPPLATVVDTYVSHFATCPKAAEHRQKKAAAQPNPQGKPR